MLWVVCYDIRDDKRRRKLVKLMEQRCQRVQYSVFEWPLAEGVLMELVEQRWLPVLALKEDSLRIYPLDQGGKGRCRVYGSPPPYEPPDYVIL
jgi:CRISPR-associated protein Cas2